MAGAHFAGVRPWQAGDPLKHIHWPSSSKGLGLQVKHFDEELSGRISFIQDCGYARREDLLDHCLRATGSLIFSALDAGHHVEWIDLSRLTQQLIPPFADGQEILDALARLTLDPDCLTRERLLQAVERLSAKSALVLMLTGLNGDVEDLVRHLQRRNRRLSLYLPESTLLPRDFTCDAVWTFSAHGITVEE